MLRFAVNASILFREHPLLERFDQSAKSGFGAVEFWWPHGENLREVASRIRDAELDVVLMNIDAGDMAAGDRGLLNDPARQAQLRANVPVAIELAERVGCKRLNALAGHWRPDEDRGPQLAFVRDNVEWIAEQAAAAGITVMIEALNSFQNGPYVFTTTRDTLAFIDSLHARNVQYQYDVYHMQRMEGNVVATLRDSIGRIGHIQVADSPDRNQPGTGELNYRFIFAAIEASGYEGFVGLEYLPRGRTDESFNWLPAERRQGIPFQALRL